MVLALPPGAGAAAEAEAEVTAEAEAALVATEATEEAAENSARVTFVMVLVSISNAGSEWQDSVSPNGDLTNRS